MRNVLVAVVVLVCSMVPVGAFAGEEDFQAQKEMVLRNIANLQDALAREKVCVDAATVKKELRVCYEQFRDEKKKFLNQGAPPRKQRGKGNYERIGE
jgi:hypothetical protein